MAASATEGPHSWVPHVLRKDISFDTTGITAGVSAGAVPAGAIIVAVTVLVTTVFNAATTNVLKVGHASDDDAYLAAGDVDETALGLTRYTGKAAKLTSATEILVAYTQTGTAATTGAASVMIEYVLDPTRYA